MGTFLRVVVDDDAPPAVFAECFARARTLDRTLSRFDPASEPARVRAMFVHPGHARRGIGRMILARAEREAWEAGFTTCELMATLPGVPLYAASGYVPVERVEIELPDGVRLECWRMNKLLGS